MKYKNFWTYLIFGAVTGIVVGILKSEIALWLIVGSLLGFVLALFFESKSNFEPDKLMWVGFFLLFPIMFFSSFLKGTFWYDFFGILAVIGSFTILVNSVKMLRKKEIKKKK